MAEVILAGYNVDAEVIKELKKNSPERADVTPETLSAAYARISRDPRSAPELRAIARQEVERARSSNQNIIFKMGHHSVAEHAVFNFDILGVSRLAIEELEKFRLCSFTEKSQRYITLTDDYMVPAEIKNSGKPELVGLFTSTVKEQNALYHQLYEKLRPYVFSQHPEMAANPQKHSTLEGWAKEDARYVVSLATQGQLGMTINSRNLEHLIRRFGSKDLVEIGDIKNQIHAVAKEVAPSLMLFTRASDFDMKTYDNLEESARDLFNEKRAEAGKAHLPMISPLIASAHPADAVKLIHYTPDADDKVIASMMHTVSGKNYELCEKKARSLSTEQKIGLFRTSFKNMDFYDTVLREFENVDLAFELVVSASCFAQLKRHRIATLTTQPYNPELGVTLPESIVGIGSEKEFMRAMGNTRDAYDVLSEQVSPLVASYVLSNAFRRRVIFKINAREFYHVSRFREDSHAQWDIRNIASDMTAQAVKAMPLTMMFIGGKHKFPEIYKKVFGYEKRSDAWKAAGY